MPFFESAAKRLLGIMQPGFHGAHGGLCDVGYFFEGEILQKMQGDDASVSRWKSLKRLVESLCVLLPDQPGVRWRCVVDPLLDGFGVQRLLAM